MWNIFYHLHHNALMTLNVWSGNLHHMLAWYGKTLCWRVVFWREQLFIKTRFVIECLPNQLKIKVQSDFGNQTQLSLISPLYKPLKFTAFFLLTNHYNVLKKHCCYGLLTVFKNVLCDERFRQTFDRIKKLVYVARLFIFNCYSTDNLEISKLSEFFEAKLWLKLKTLMKTITGNLFHQALLKKLFFFQKELLKLSIGSSESLKMKSFTDIDWRLRI